MKNKDKSLTIKIVQDQLVISIGVSTLAYCVSHDENNDWNKDFKIDNEKEFCKSILLSLCDENEVGNSLLTKLFDDATNEALESGRLGFREATDKEKEQYEEDYG